MGKETTRTYGTRPKINPEKDEALHLFAKLFGDVKHHLFSARSAGKELNTLKTEYIKKYQITARHFNAAKVSIEGQIESIKQRQKGLIASKREEIEVLKKKIERFSKRKINRLLVHQKKRRLHKLQTALASLEKDHNNGTCRLCFGSKKLFRAQFNLEANGYQNHKEWHKDWGQSRASEIFFLGSKDETSGNQTCTATIQEDQTLSLRIRLPDSIAAKGKYLTLDHIKFAYGQDEILAALINGNQAISWRFILDKKGWRIFATLDITAPPITSDQKLGVIGLDINVDHLAITETDRFGNPILTKTIPLPVKHKTTHQIEAIIGDAAAEAIAFAKETKKPLVIEKLDFQKKKTTLREEKSAYIARTLSSFAYQSIITHLKSRGLRNGVLVIQVNPAYTSIIGRMKFAKRYGLSIHHAAALTIGRRFLGFSEKPPSTTDRIPDGKSGHVTLALPVRNRAKHVWSHWRELNKKLLAALKAHFRTVNNRSSSTVKTVCETLSSEVNGEIPLCESSEELLA